jgi:hypothetical protein
MSKKHNCCSDDHEIRVHKLTLDDGRHAERHLSVDEDGNEVVEIFAEEKRPLKLEKRIHREFKNVVSKETHETIKDGEVAHVEVRSTESEVPLKVVDRIGIVNHAKIVDGDYVRKEELGKIVADSVVAGVSALMESMEPVYHREEPVYHREEPVYHREETTQPQPIFKAQSVVENNVAEKNKNQLTTNIIIAVVLLAQLVFFGYMFFVM